MQPGSQSVAGGVSAGTQQVAAVTLDDKWTVSRGRILLSGTQALARILLAQKELDRRHGINSAGYISGYRGSPLGNVDLALWSIDERLRAAEILFQPGLNEDIAATAIRGTQQLDAIPDPTHDGVFAAWYGKGPGVDRSCDALKHGNFSGAHRHGGVVVFYGDDHAGKSSSVAHHSEQALASCLIPSFYPANTSEIIEYGLLGYALSRYSGSWVGLKCVNEVIEQTASVDLDLDSFQPHMPAPVQLPPEGVHPNVGVFRPLREEQIVIEHRLPLVHAFVRANGIDRTIFRGARPRLGLVTAGKSYGDVRTALTLLGLDPARAAALGISLYKVGCIWPLECEGVAAFASGHQVLFVIEEKQSFVEAQLAAALFNRAERPLLIGKADEAGAPLLSSTLPLQPIDVAIAIAERLERLGIADPMVRAARAELGAPAARGEVDAAGLPKRSPYFCSGCPHNRSTRIPAGSISMTGIGCHTMVNLVRPAEALPPTHMGGEGGNWLGIAPFTRTKHMFQNMGDGTYYHSGLLAIRAAVAASVNITYKILYNDAVAMTGGQPVDGPLSVARIAQQVRHEGVQTIVIVSDNPEPHRNDPGLPAAVRIRHREELDAVQRELRDTPGCTVLIYDQTCAAEKRRRRKRGQYPDPPKRQFIAQAVCEGCGDCSVQSTCVSLLPVETDFGTKRRIDQSSCNKDYSCADGFCPSFITVHGAEPRKPRAAQVDSAVFKDLPEPRRAGIARDNYNLMVAGIGGTGVITVAAIIGMAAHIDGLAASIFDMTGLAQKNGAVYSHVRIAHAPDRLFAQRIGQREADVLLAFDLVAALGEEAAITVSSGRTRAVVNSNVAPTVAFQFDRDAVVDSSLPMARLKRVIGEGAIVTVDAVTLATSLLGDSIAANLFVVGVAAQRGLLPVSASALEQAVRLNGTAVALNLAAFGLGRLFAVRPDEVLARVKASTSGSALPLAASLDEIVARRADHLTAYQNAAYASRYRAQIERVRAAEEPVAPGSHLLTTAVARNYAKLLAYKDEYEVARLLASPALHQELKQTFADGARLSFNLAPPILPGKMPNGRPRKRAFNASLTLPMLRTLTRLRWLRATRFDPFGRTAERRMERALITHYEALIDVVLKQLSRQNHAAAVKLLGLADMIRGFGPVKEQAVAGYYTQVKQAQESFARAP